VFPKHKGDESGEVSLPKHVYANPSQPFCCPILAFGLYEFTRGYRSRASLLFESKFEATEARFSKWLLNTCENISDSLLTFGLELIDLGTHSFRKGAASFLSSMPGGASIIAIYLRAGWSLGPVQSRYILECDGGDQLCGRAATGLSITDANFAALPPHFLSEVIIDWDIIIPNYSNIYPENFKPGDVAFSNLVINISNNTYIFKNSFSNASCFNYLS
jgi:hypothetical protein